MPRLRKKHLPHRIDVTLAAGVNMFGPVLADPSLDVPAYVEQKTRLVIDRRAESPTKGQEITSTTFVVALSDTDIPPGATVTVWKGTAFERTSTVITRDVFDYPGAPSHLELFLE